MSTTDPVAAMEESTRPDSAAAEHAGAAQMFAFSSFIHVGPGAAECEAIDRQTFDCSCSNPAHFHAWARLPNQFQRRDIVQKAEAAAALAEQVCRTEGTSAHAVMESEMRVLSQAGSVTVIADELLQESWAQNYLTATQEVNQDERFEHIEAQREHYAALAVAENDKPEDEQSDEYKVLGASIAAYVAEVRERYIAIEKPERDRLEALGLDQLVDALRDLRIRKLGKAAFWDTYYQWMWYVGTLKIEADPTYRRPWRRVWASLGSVESEEPGSLWSAAPEIIEVVKTTFSELDQSFNAGSMGNPS